MAIAFGYDDALQWKELMKREGFSTSNVRVACRHCGIVGVFTITCRTGCITDQLCQKHSYLTNDHYCYKPECQESKAADTEHLKRWQDLQTR